MRISKNGLSLIMEFEGLRLKPYLCSAKVATIGYGTTIYPDGKKVSLTDGAITKEMAIDYLMNDVRKFEYGVIKLVGKTLLNQNQFDALVCFAYNVGLYALEKSTLLKLVKALPHSEAIYTQFLRWNKAGGQVINGLTRRRKAEADLYFK